MARRFFLLLGILSVLLVPCMLQAQTAADCDFDRSGSVDFPDFLAFVGAYGSIQIKYDLDGSGTVEFPDFLIFVRFYGQAVWQGPEKEITVNLPGGATMEMVYVPSGTYAMGSPDTELWRDSDEGPQHEVTISNGFYLGKSEVTQAQWQAVMGSNPSFYQGANRPVEMVSWYDVHGFIHRLNVAAGDSLYGLPTEAEWEYACRAGTTTWWSFGEDESKLRDYVWYKGDGSPPGTKEVGMKEPNAWGLYDMHGNVWEWCQDWYGPYPSGPQTDPQGPVWGAIRVVRGGGFYDDSRRVRSANRFSNAPSNRDVVGCRMLRRAE